MEFRTWLITDTHFNDRKMISAGRDEDYQERTLENCRMLIQEQDLVYHLGDVINDKFGELKGIMESLPGRWVLLQGNHDTKPPFWYMRNGFAYVADIVKVGSVLLSHKPQRTLPNGVSLNIHGHWHTRSHANDKHYRGYYNKREYKRLSLEKEDYMPVELDDWLNLQRRHPKGRRKSNGRKRSQDKSYMSRGMSGKDLISDMMTEHC